MSKVALFNSAGRCLGVFTGAQDLSVLDYAYAAEVGDDSLPNTLAFNQTLNQAEQITYTPVRVDPTDMLGSMPADGGEGIKAKALLGKEVL